MPDSLPDSVYSAYALADESASLPASVSLSMRRLLSRGSSSTFRKPREAMDSTSLLADGGVTPRWDASSDRDELSLARRKESTRNWGTVTPDPSLIHALSLLEAIRSASISDAAGSSVPALLLDILTISKCNIYLRRA
jgi:hypothetical protein